MRAAASAIGAALGTAPAAAADVAYDHYTGAPFAAPRYLGADEPWSNRLERPPRKGYWFFTAPDTPTVNFLVPMGRARAIEPFTPAWYAYCEARWPSFNPRSGTVVTPDGVRMCF